MRPIVIYRQYLRFAAKFCRECYAKFEFFAEFAELSFFFQFNLCSWRMRVQFEKFSHFVELGLCEKCRSVLWANWDAWEEVWHVEGNLPVTGHTYAVVANAGWR
jgi:hypothetical protein